MIQLTDKEEEFANAFYSDYIKYDGNIPNTRWNALGRLRESLGITIGRGTRITNYIEQNPHDFVPQKSEKEEDWDLIREYLNSKNYDNDVYQKQIDTWLETYDITEEEQMLCYYYKAIGWQQEYYLLSEKEVPAEECEDHDYKLKESNIQTIKNIDKAIAWLDESNHDYWICTLLTIKSKMLHEKGEHVEAVRLAISALPYACDDTEKENAKWQITGKHWKDSNDLASTAGYGLVGWNVEERIKRCIEFNRYEYEKDCSLAENYELLSWNGELFIQGIQDIKNGEYTLSSRPYHERQFIFTVRDLEHIGGCYDETDTIQYVFAIDELPKNISFPIGHPQPNTLYYAHPLRPAYLPFENAQTLLFHERIQELCRLFQCLGATKITARCLKGEKISQSAITSNDINLEGSYKIASGSASYSRRNDSTSHRGEKSEMFLEQSFSPKRYPYCPKDLVWAVNDPEVQTFIHQRLEGSLLSLSKRVSAFETSSLTQNQADNAKVAFQSLMANVSANYSTFTDSTFKSVYETEWELNVQFKPLEEFDASTLNLDELTLPDDAHILMPIEKFCPIGDIGIGIIGTLMKDIKKGDKVIIGDKTSIFKSEVKEVIVYFKLLGEGEAGDENVILFLDGVTPTNIWPGMNIYLDNTTTETTKKGNSTTILTTEISNKLSENEGKYKEEILFCLEDNDAITEEDRRYLERKRKKLGITEERAKAIEQSITPSLNDNEKEYLETFKEMRTGSTLTDRARRLLDREREALGISKARSKEIEALIKE